MKPIGCESCGLAEGLAILKVKSLKFDVRRLKIVKFSPKLAVAEKRNRAAPENRDHGSQTGPLAQGVSRVFKSFEKEFLKSCIKNLATLAEQSWHKTK